ncbi:MAG: hypothetical protein JWM73_339, partial [Solirubrobacterales bacterium]|nr:hypothetical protein [Solirubrobacterales bacterium]
ASQLLSTGAPVPDDPQRTEPGRPRAAPHAAGTLLSVRVADPEGGLSWGIATYPATMGGIVGCAYVGRVHEGRVGILGRDGAFGDDGRFHPLTPRSQQSGTCSGGRDGHMRGVAFGAPVPASGYSGPAGPPVGGCRERVDLRGPTVSPQTRRRLRDVPQCAKDSLRVIPYGFAGLKARSVTLSGAGFARTVRVRPREDGAFLFVLRPADFHHRALELTFHDGRGRRVGWPMPVDPPR